jgi:hypothetical protein
MFDVTVLETLVDKELPTKAATIRFNFDRGFLPTVSFFFLRFQNLTVFLLLCII